MQNRKEIIMGERTQLLLNVHDKDEQLLGSIVHYQWGGSGISMILDTINLIYNFPQYDFQVRENTYPELAKYLQHADIKHPNIMCNLYDWLKNTTNASLVDEINLKQINSNIKYTSPTDKIDNMLSEALMNDINDLKYCDNNDGYLILDIDVDYQKPKMQTSLLALDHCGHQSTLHEYFKTIMHSKVTMFDDLLDYLDVNRTK